MIFSTALGPVQIIISGNFKKVNNVCIFFQTILVVLGPCSLYEANLRELPDFVILLPETLRRLYLISTQTINFENSRS